MLTDAEGSSKCDLSLRVCERVRRRVGVAAGRQHEDGFVRQPDGMRKDQDFPVQLDESDADAKRLIGPDGDVVLREGYIALQSESHPIEFRKVEVLRLD